MYRSILVHLDHSKHCPARIDTACALALDFDAHLIGLYAIDGREIASDSATANAMMERMGLVPSQAARYMSLFEERASRAGVSKREMREAPGDAVANVALHARYCDLAILGQGDPDEQLTGVTPVFAESVVLAAGTPVLLLPYYTDAFKSIGRRALIAWNGEREAARAVRDALPFLRRAQQVHALNVHSKAGRQRAPSLSVDLSMYLTQHGIRIDAAETFATGDMQVGDTLLARLSDYDADLVVMGAYGHSRLRELVLGGVTQTFLRHMTAPVLMSH